MVTVSKEQMRVVQYFISQSIQGNHVLFDAEEMRKVLRESKELEPEIEFSYQIEPHLERLMTLPSLAQKRAYLEKLEPHTYAGLVRAYFHIVENHLLERKPLSEQSH